MKTHQIKISLKCFWYVKSFQWSVLWSYVYQTTWWLKMTWAVSCWKPYMLRWPLLVPGEKIGCTAYSSQWKMLSNVYFTPLHTFITFAQKPLLEVTNSKLKIMTYNWTMLGLQKITQFLLQLVIWRVVSGRSVKHIWTYNFFSTTHNLPCDELCQKSPYFLWS